MTSDSSRRQIDHPMSSLGHCVFPTHEETWRNLKKPPPNLSGRGWTSGTSCLSIAPSPRMPTGWRWYSLPISPPAFCRNSSSLLLACSSTSLHWMEWSYCCPNIFATPTAPFHLAFISQVLLLREDHWATERPKNWERGRPEIRELELNYTVSSEGCTNRSSSTVVPIHILISSYINCVRMVHVFKKSQHAHVWSCL